MASWLVGKYLILTVGRFWERLHVGAAFIYLILVLGLFLLGSLFWVAGSQANSDFQLLPGLILMTMVIGGWTGLAYIGQRRPSGLNWLNKTSWFWLQALPGMVISLLLILTTALPYYLSHSWAETNSLWLKFALKLTIMMLLIGTTLLGTTLSLAIRRLSRVGFIRLCLLVLAGYVLFSLTAVFSGTLAIIERSLFELNPDRLVMILLFSLSVIAVGGILTGLLMEQTPLSIKKSDKFWPISFQNRIFVGSHSREVSYYLSQLLYFVRSHHFQRRVIILTVSAVLLLILSQAFQISDQSKVALSAAVSWLLAYFISVGAGQLTAMDSQRLRLLPVSKREIFTAGYAAGLTVLAVILLAVNQFSSLPIAIAGQSYLIAIVIHTLLFTFGYFSNQSRIDQNKGFGDEKILIGVMLSIAVAGIPVFLYGQVGSWTLSWLLGVWLIGIWFSLTRVVLRSR